MKNIIASFIFVITALCTLAQAPQSFNYQAVLRDAAGNILGNNDVEIQVEILQGSASGSAIFSETHSTTTNNFGLVNLSVGSISSTDLSNIDWTDGPFFIQISVDGTVMGTSQLLSVPFAMHAISVENDAVEDDDADPENEIQVLSINADTIFLSSGGFVVLPPETDPAFTNWDKSSGITISESQILDLKHFTGESITGNETAFDGWDKNANDDFTTNDETDPVFSNSLAAAITAADTARWASNNDIQNELQNLSIENQQLSISGGNTIDLSDAYYIADSSATNELQDISLNGTLLSISKGSTVDLAEVQDGDKQRLSLGVTNQHDIRLNISNANFVEMPFVKDGVSKYNWSEAENYVAKWGQYGAMVKSTIYDNGNIGIGTETPGAKLEVTGQIKITGAEPGDGKVLTSDANGLASWKIESDPQVGANTENYVPKWDGSKLISGTVYDNGNIGIGTNTPGAKLEIAGQVKITGGEPGADKILVSDASGLASWKPNLDNDPTNELQALSISNDTIYLSNGNYVKLPLASALADADNDTKIQVEESPDEDMLRVDIAGNETLTMSNSTGTILRLPTNDNNSSLKVSKNNGTVVFGVDGQGLLNGDGSGLSNVKSLLGYSGGDYRKQVTSTDPYNPTLMKTVEITVDGPGKVLIQATGYADWESTGCDYYRLSALPDNIQTGSQSFANKYFDYLMIDTDKGCQDSTEQYSPLAYSRVFNVGSAGTYTYNLWADRVFSSSLVEMGDINMQAIYFPTGGTGSATLKSAEIRKAEENKEPFDRSLLRNIDGSYSAIQADDEYEIKSPPEDELNNQEIIIQKLEERIKLLENKLELLLQEKLE